jgi:hypothetical protein
MDEDLNMGRVTEISIWIFIATGCTGLVMALIVNGLWALAR